MINPKFSPRDAATAYLSGRRSPSARYASWDHCFNYFRGFAEQGRHELVASPENVQSSCLNLGFYLASWGMYRGKSTLLKRSSQALEDLVNVIAQTPEGLWDLDIASYDNNSIRDLMDSSMEIRNALSRLSNEGAGRTASDTLTTKVMLGVFGNVPAFDRFFKQGLGVGSLNQKSLLKIKDFYDRNRQDVEDFRVPSMDFRGNPSGFRYTQAKVVDMMFFVMGGGLSVS